MELEAARLAVSPQGLALIDALPPYASINPLKFAEQLQAQGAAPELVAVALTQARLRAAAESKFGDFARGMIFTPAGLEQATRLEVAARHAARYRDAGITRVADLTAGIGADAMALAGLGLDVMAFERDEATAIIADHNLRHWPNTVVVHGDSMETVGRGTLDVDGLFVDPARRTAHGRRHDPRDYEPALDAVIGLRDRFPALGVKVGPGIPHEAVPRGTGKSRVEAQWVSVDGDVVEAGLWFGPLAHASGHTALVIRDGEAHELSGSTAHAETAKLRAWIHEPDGAVIRSGLVGVLAQQLNAHLVDPTIAYLTSREGTMSPFATAFRVLEKLPYGERELAYALRSRNVGIVEIKKRGIDVAPEGLRRRLKLSGSESATVILTRIDGKRMALIVERVQA